MLRAYKRARIREKTHKAVIQLPRRRDASPYVCEWHLDAVWPSSCSKSLSSLRAQDFQREPDRHRSLPRSVVGSTFAVLRQFVCDLIPRSSRIHATVKVRPNSGIVIEGSHANRYLWTLWPVAAEQARTAFHTESFHRAFAFPITLINFCPCSRGNCSLQHARLGTNGGARMFVVTLATSWRRGATL